MTTLDWHRMTSVEEDGAGYDVVVDVMPGWIGDEAADWNGVLVRTGRPGWWWTARQAHLGGWSESGEADTKEEAMTDAMRTVEQWQAHDRPQ